MKKPKILFLDDDENRCKRYQSKYPHATITTTVPECIDALSQDESWHTVSLDHDLGYETFVDSSREDCGMEVVRFLELLDEPLKISRIIIHSFNHGAAEEMVRRIKAIGYNCIEQPFVE